MRLLLLTHEFPPFRGGVGTYASELAQAAAELGHTVTVYAPQHAAFTPEQAQGACDYRVVRFPGDLYAARRFPRLLYTTLRALAIETFDCVHAVDATFSMALGLAHRVWRQSFLCTVHGSELLALPRSAHLRLLHLRDLYTRPVKVCVNSNYTKDLLLKTCPGIPPERVAVTTLGVSDWWFQRVPEAQRAALRQKLNLTVGHCIVSTVARVIERKGHLATIEALKRLPGHVRSHVVYVIAGRGDDDAYVDRVKAAAMQAGIQTRFARSMDRG